MTALQAQAGKFPGHQRGALEGLWQQASVVVAQQRNIRHELAEHQLGLGHSHFCRQPRAPVVAGGATIVMHRQQLRTAALRAAVELDAQHRDTVQAKADNARGVTGTELENRALGPFFYLALAGAGIVEVPIEVVISQRQAGLGIFEKAAAFSVYRRHQGKRHCTAEQGPGRERKVSHYCCFPGGCCQ
ncbi:hypothetical protein D3C85_1332280 [compost metagenome]